MKLVIDIPEEIVESVKYGNVYIAGTRSNGKTIFCKITDAIANATPLTDCTDAISRSAVMKLLESRYSSDTIMSIYEEVLELPSVNPTRPKAKWIPVSEKLPEEYICDDGYIEPSDYVLVWGDHGNYGISRYWGNRRSKSESPNTYKDWMDLDWVAQKPIAWMPLPEPYSAEMESE